MAYSWRANEKSDLSAPRGHIAGWARSRSRQDVAPAMCPQRLVRSHHVGASPSPPSGHRRRLPRRGDEQRSVLHHSGEVGARVLAVDALQGLRHLARVGALGVAVDDLAGVGDGAAVHPPREEWREHSAVRAAEKARGVGDGAVHAARGGGVCLPLRRQADSVRVAAEAGDAGGFLSGGEGGYGAGGGASASCRKGRMRSTNDSACPARNLRKRCPWTIAGRHRRLGPRPCPQGWS